MECRRFGKYRRRFSGGVILFWGNEVWQLLLLYGCYDVSVRWTPVSVAQNHLFVGGYGGLRRAINCWTINSGNLAVCYGKSPCLIGKSRKIGNFHPCYMFFYLLPFPISLLPIKQILTNSYKDTMWFVKLPYAKGYLPLLQGWQVATHNTSHQVEVHTASGSAKEGEEFRAPRFWRFFVERYWGYNGDAHGILLFNGYIMVI